MLSWIALYRLSHHPSTTLSIINTVARVLIEYENRGETTRELYFDRSRDGADTDIPVTSSVISRKRPGERQGLHP